MSRYHDTYNSAGSAGRHGASDKPTAYALICESQSVGKRVKSTKRRILWKFVFAEDAESKRNTPQNVELKHSVVSGKRSVSYNGRRVHESKNNIAQKVEFDFSWKTNQRGNHLIRVIIREEPDRFIYSLYVDAVPYRLLPKFEQFQNRQLTRTVDPSLADNAFGEDFDDEGDFSAPAKSSWTTFGEDGGQEPFEDSSSEEEDFDPFGGEPAPAQRMESTTKHEDDEFDPFSDSAVNTNERSTGQQPNGDEFDPFEDGPSNGGPDNTSESADFDPFGDSAPAPSSKLQPASDSQPDLLAFDAPAPATSVTNASARAVGFDPFAPNPVQTTSASGRNPGGSSVGGLDLGALYAPASGAPGQNRTGMMGNGVGMGMGAGMGMGMGMGGSAGMAGGMRGMGAGYGHQPQVMNGGYGMYNNRSGGAQQPYGMQQQMGFPMGHGYQQPRPQQGYRQGQQFQQPAPAPGPAPAPAPALAPAPAPAPPPTQADFNPFDDF